jgi:hypothetical protein
MEDLPTISPDPGGPEEVPPAEPTRTVAGVLGLTLAAVAVLCLPLGILTWGLAWLVVAPLAITGVAFSLAARGWMRIVGVTLGVVLSGLGVAFWMAIINAQKVGG